MQMIIFISIILLLVRSAISLKNRKIFSFSLIFFSFMLFSCNKNPSIYDLSLNPELHKKYAKPSVWDYCFVLDKNEYQEFITNTYNKAERNYDLKKYEDAIYNYKEVLVAFAFVNNRPVFNVPFENTSQNYKTRYFSLYNIACCYSLLGNNTEAEEFLIKAIKSGYPYIDHIMKDEDLFSFFKSNPKMKQKVIDCFNNGNNKKTVLGKEINLVGGPSSGNSFKFVNEDFVIYQPWGEGWKKYNDKYYGTYKLKNYSVIISFYKEEYGDLSNSEAYYKDIREENYKNVSLDINESMVLPLAIEENNLISFSEL